MSYALDAGAGGGRRLGLILLSTDETLEYEARAMLAGRAVNLLHTRIPAHAHVTPETLRLMEDAMTAAAGLLPAGLNAVAYACTSGATVIGSATVARLIQAAHPGVAVTDPLLAATAALRRLGVARIALVTPYLPSISIPMRAAFAQQGIETVSEISFGQQDDWTVARITEESTLAAILEAGRAEGVEAVFASCTNLRSLGILERAEAALGLPVVSSNLAVIWHLLALGEVPAQGWAPGRLFRA